MTLVASRVTDGFELVRNLANVTDNPVELELTPNTEFKRGDMVVWTNGKIAAAAANATGIAGVMAESIAQADNPAAGLTFGKVYTNPLNVYRCSFVDHRDAAATGGTTTTLIDTEVANSADNRYRGALIYIYAGPGAGSVRTVSAYTNATRTFTVTYPFPVAPTTASKYILLGSAAADANHINVGVVGIDLKDENTIDADAAVASEAGPLTAVAIYPKDLMMDVVIRKHWLNSV